jgi:putative CocE/NonD family hydrolase
MSIARPAAAQRTARPRPVGRTADAFSRMLTRTWSLPPRRNRVTIEAKLGVPMSDGTVLLADHYIPVTGRAAATVLVRCPYGRGAPFSMLTAQLVAERGYHVLMQSCRGTFGSGGAFEPMRNEITDGQDTVAWLREQSWFDGRLGTFGPSYLGFVQWALAMDPPSELKASVVLVGPHDFSRVAFRNGVHDLYTWLQWCDLIAHQERLSGARGIFRTVTIERRLTPAVERMPALAGARALLGNDAPWYESWPEHPRLDDPFWAPLQCGAALDRLSAPTLLIGGWHDLFLEQTLEQYRALSARGVPARLLVGPWAHLDTSRSGPVFRESLEWLDRHLGPEAGTETGTETGTEAGTEASSGAHGMPVRVHVGGAGEWRDLPDWPPPGTKQQRWYLGTGQAAETGYTLSTQQPAAGGLDAEFRYDPADPTPLPGGAIMVPSAGARDNRNAEQRPDVLVFSTEQLAQPVEALGNVSVELAVTRDNPYADLFVRLCDVDSRGKSLNVCEGILRLTETQTEAETQTVQISMLGLAHRFDAGHRMRLLVAGGAYPRYARNPGNGLVDAPAEDLVPTSYRIGTAGDSALVLDVTAVP